MNQEIITALINAGIELIELSIKVTNDLKQSGELTPEEEKKLDSAIATLKQKPWWREED